MIEIVCTMAAGGTVAVARADGREARGTDCIGHLLRMLYDPGRPDAPWLVRDAAGRETARGASARRRAARVLSETDHGFGWGWWRAHPKAPARPDLEALVERERGAAKAQKEGRR